MIKILSFDTLIHGEEERITYLSVALDRENLVHEVIVITTDVHIDNGTSLSLLARLARAWATLKEEGPTPLLHIVLWTNELKFPNQFAYMIGREEPIRDWSGEEEEEVEKFSDSSNISNPEAISVTEYIRRTRETYNGLDAQRKEFKVRKQLERRIASANTRWERYDRSERNYDRRIRNRNKKTRKK